MDFTKKTTSELYDLETKLKAKYDKSTGREAYGLGDKVRAVEAELLKRSLKEINFDTYDFNRR